jgi:hypothetical protein
MTWEPVRDSLAQSRLQGSKPDLLIRSGLLHACSIPSSREDFFLQKRNRWQDQDFVGGWSLGKTPPLLIPAETYRRKNLKLHLKMLSVLFSC